MPTLKRPRDNNNNLIASLRNAQFVENPNPNNERNGVVLGIPFINRETVNRRRDENNMREQQNQRRRQLRNNARYAYAFERSLNNALTRFGTNRGIISPSTRTEIVQRIRNFSSAYPSFALAYTAMSGNRSARQRFLGDIYSMLNTATRRVRRRMS